MSSNTVVQMIVEPASTVELVVEKPVNETTLEVTAASTVTMDVTAAKGATMAVAVPRSASLTVQKPTVSLTMDVTVPPSVSLDVVARGPQGVQGVQGAQGSTSGGSGSQGAQGVQGSTGAQGASGVAGSQGAAGPQGLTGAQGAAITGPQGVAGAAGSQGAAGGNGAQGSQGVAGSAGAQGSQGAAGSAGSQGAQGAAGAAGSQGAQGSPGSQGSQGSQGAAGGAAMTTKGDLDGFSTVPARVSVGADGIPLQADSAQPVGLGYGTRDYTFNNKNLLNVAGLAIGASSLLNSGQLELTEGRTFAAAVGVNGIYMGGAAVFTTGASGSQYSMINIGSSASSSVPLAAVFGLSFAPSVAMTNAALTQLTAVLGQPSFGKSGTGSFTAVHAFEANPIQVGANSAAVVRGYYVNFGGTAPTLGIGFHVGTLTGTTKWAFYDSTLNNSAIGSLSLGAITAPTWDLHLRRGASAKSAIGFDASTTAPTTPGSSAGMAITCYQGSAANQYAFFIFNDAGTPKYLYTKLTGATAGAAVWTIAATLPT